jgi:predicted transcriptional regulator
MASVKKEKTSPIRVDTTTHKRLKQVAAGFGVPMSKLAIEALRGFLDRVEA